MIGKIKDSFQFNKRERNGILLLSFILLFFIFFYQFSYLLKQESKTDFSSFEKALSELEYKQESVIEKQKYSLFYFNPNTLSDEGWLALGLSSKRINTLRNFQKTGATFKTKEDLKKCFSITDEFYKRIKEFVLIPEIKNSGTRIIKPKTTRQLVEINQADSLQLITINGVGPFYAKQILKYRKQLGGFISYNQITEIWGLENLEFEKFK